MPIESIRARVARAAATLALTLSAAAGAAPLAPSAFFDWAERGFPAIFPSRQADRTLEPYVYRHYPEANTFLAVDGQVVLYFGPIGNYQLLTLGRLSDFACAVDVTQCGPGPLDGRSWMPARPAESNDAAPQRVTAASDDAGNVILAYVKSEGDRSVVYASRCVPATGDCTHRVIDGGGSDPRPPKGNLALAVAPRGDAVVAWLADDACTATTYRTSGTCSYIHFARYSAADDRWTAAVKGPDTTDDPIALHLNDRGDFMIRMTGWIRVGSSVTFHKAVAWLPRQEITFRRRVFSEVTLDKWISGLDAAGNLVVAGEARLAGNGEIVVYWSNDTRSALLPQTTVDRRGATATLVDAHMGQGGQLALTWTQNNGTRSTRYAAVAAAPRAQFVVKDLEFPLAGAGGDLSKVVVTDAGEVFAYEFQDRAFRRWSGGVWSSIQTLPPELDANAGTANTFSRRGDILSVQTRQGPCREGSWASYDATTGRMVKAFATANPADWVLGLDTCTRAVGASAPILSVGGIGAQWFSNAYDLMPSAAQPAGTGRPGISNVWIAFLR